MGALTSRAFCIFAASAVVTFNVTAQERDRSKIDDKYKWNLGDIYPSDAAWRAAKDKVVAEIPVPTSVVGPPFSVAITPDESLALVTSAMQIDPADSTRRAS